MSARRVSGDTLSLAFVSTSNKRVQLYATLSNFAGLSRREAQEFDFTRWNKNETWTQTLCRMSKHAYHWDTPRIMWVSSNRGFISVSLKNGGIPYQYTIMTSRSVIHCWWQGRPGYQGYSGHPSLTWCTDLLSTFTWEFDLVP